MAYAGIFALLGLVLLGAIAGFGVSPLALPFAGGFMLVGPILLTGYFEIARLEQQQARPRLGDAIAAFARVPAGLWLVALACAFLFLIWITDAGILYSFTIGGRYPAFGSNGVSVPEDGLLLFTLWGSLMGSVLAYLIFAVSAFAVPLIYERRAGAVQGMQISVQTVVGNFGVCLAWGIVLGTVIVVSVLLLPLLLVSLPVMSYASFALYRRAFPPESPATASAGGVETG